jgi:hypothetical protein
MRRILFATSFGALLVAASVTSATAQELSRYRDFALGTTVASIAATLGLPVSAIRTLHNEPALLQEFEWRPSHYARTPDAQTDSVQQITFTFYNDQLSQMVITYDYRQTAELTNADMIGSLTGMYGAPAPPKRTGADQQDFGVTVATWPASGGLVVLYRGSDALRLVLTSRALDAAARTATAQALRIEERDAPARELAQQRKDAAAERVRQEQTRRTNKAAFQP